MRYRWTATIMAAMLGLTASPVSGQSEAPAATAEDESISLLAVVTASEGRYDASSDGIGSLTLEGVEQATWFSDRPARQVGVYTIEEMNEVFFTDQVPPNAALEMVKGPDEPQDVVILELSSPVWDAESGSLAYDAVVLEPGTLAPDGSRPRRAPRPCRCRRPGDVRHRRPLHRLGRLLCPFSGPGRWQANLLSGITCAKLQDLVDPTSNALWVRPMALQSPA